MNRLLAFPARRKLSLAGALLATTVLVGGGLTYSRSDAAVSAVDAPLGLPAVSTQVGFADLAAKVKPAVVNISISRPAEVSSTPEMPQAPEGSPMGEMYKHFFDRRGAAPEHALGSGFIIDPAGYIVTNNHVVEGAKNVTVTLDDGSSYSATVVGRDAKTDLAVLKVDAKKPLPYVAFGDSDKSRVGDWVVAIGNPFGLGGTVTAGIVSGHDRDINNGPYDDFLQIDAPINPGNSGGPLFNQSGQVIGIDTAIYSPNGGSVGIGFAIPSNIATKVVGQLREHGRVERGWLGIQMQPMSPQLATAVGLSKSEGVIVDQVEANSPAARAELHQGDVITAFDGNAIKGTRDLALAVAGAPTGKTATLTVWRNGSEKSISVVIAAQAKDKIAATATDQGQSAPVGMALAPLTPDARSEMGLAPNAKGAVVAEVKPGSLAEVSGVRAGDLILNVGNDVISTPDEAASKIHEAQNAKKEAIALLVSRNGTAYYLALQLSQG
ncbi:MAG TPA: Do family serine endopeptidase [Stellaceae bacterium]|nr:Do family serine endopeptidase [Stellaceae bacterium]